MDLRPSRMVCVLSQDDVHDPSPASTTPRTIQEPVSVRHPFRLPSGCRGRPWHRSLASPAAYAHDRGAALWVIAQSPLGRVSQRWFSLAARQTDWIGRGQVLPLHIRSRHLDQLVSRDSVARVGRTSPLSDRRVGSNRTLSFSPCWRIAHSSCLRIVTMVIGGGKRRSSSVIGCHRHQRRISWQVHSAVVVHVTRIRAYYPSHDLPEAEQVGGS